MEDIAVQTNPRVGGRIPGLVPSMVGLIWCALIALFGSTDLVQWIWGALPRILFLLVVVVALYLLPGLALLQILWRGVAISRAERLALACGISVALPPLLLEIAHLVGLPWTRWTTLGYVVVAAIAVAPRFNSTWRNSTRLPVGPSWSTIMLASLIGIALLVRLYIVRGLPVGMWGDSYHHTMIAQLLVDNRGLFSSWKPYAPLVTFTYHYGFHANVALFHWLSGISVSQSVLYVGQIIGTATLPLAYVLTTRLLRSHAAGLWAVALTGFINTQPAYYVNWGRYTQLTGQVLLPVVVLCWVEAIECSRRNWRRIVVAGIVTACLVLTHYLVTIFAALFLSAYLLAYIVRHRNQHALQQVAGTALLIGALALVLTTPWLLNLLTGYLTHIAAGVVSKNSGAKAAATSDTLPALTPLFLTSMILALAFVGLLLACVRRTWNVMLLAVWSGLLILASRPNLVGLPGKGIITDFTAYIALYLTVIPIAAYALSYGQQLLGAWRPRVSNAVATVLLMTSTAWGVHWQQDVLNPANELFTPADADAMTWVRKSTPADAHFLVNMFPAYDNTVVVGSDGGWWLPLLTGRHTTLPPITYASEWAAIPHYIQSVNEFAAKLRAHPLPSEQGIKLMRDAGIRYIYTGAHVGQDDPIDVQALRHHPAFRVAYDRMGVVIFALLPS